MASELSKLIEDQLQKHDEEAPLSPTEKQRLLSSSLRIKTSPGRKQDKRSPIMKLSKELPTSPGRKQEKRSPIVKLNKEQPAPLSVSGASVPVPSGQSWVTEDTQKYKWTKWRIILAVSTVFVIAIALTVAFSHPSSKIHHSAISGYMQGNTTDKPLLGALMGRGKAAQAQAPQAAKMMATTQEPSTLGYGSMSAEEEDLSTFGYGSSGYGSSAATKDEGLAAGNRLDVGAAETAPVTSHHKAHATHAHGQHHAHQQQHGPAGFETAYTTPSSGVTPGMSTASKFGAFGASSATYGASMKDNAASSLSVPGPAPAGAPRGAAMLPPTMVPSMVPGPGPASSLAPSALLRTKLAPGPAKARRSSGKSAGIYTVAGVAGSTPSLTQPLAGGYPSTEAWDNIHGGGVGSLEQQDVEGVASVAGGPGTVSAGNEYDSDEWADEETTDAGMSSEDMAEEMEVAGGYPGQSSGGQSYAEEDDYEG